MKHLSRLVPIQTGNLTIGDEFRQRFGGSFRKKLTDINPYKSWGLKGTLYFILKRYPLSTIWLNYMLMYPRLNTKRAKIRQEVNLNE